MRAGSRAGTTFSRSAKDGGGKLRNYGKKWEEVGRISGRRGEAEGPFKSRRGFGFHVRQARVRPSNTTVRELMSDDRYTGAVLDFLGKTRVGEVKEGVICK